MPKMVEREHIVLSEISQTQKGKYNTCSPVCGNCPNLKVEEALLGTGKGPGKEERKGKRKDRHDNTSCTCTEILQQVPLFVQLICVYSSRKKEVEITKYHDTLEKIKVFVGEQKTYLL